MQSTILGLGLLLISGTVHGQECRADFNHNGTTDISDLIVAVNEALTGCGPTPTPVGTCPYYFQNTLSATTDPLCHYRGEYHGDRSCDGAELGATWYGDGAYLVFVLDTVPQIAIGAEWTDARTAKLLLWSTNGFQHPPWNGLLGSIILDNVRAQFTMSLSHSVFMIDECAVTRYTGTFTGLGDPAATTGIDGLLRFANHVTQ